MLEVERKFRVAALPDEALGGGGARLRQAYVALDGDVQVRVRDEDGRCTLTVKGGRGMVRAEVETSVERPQFEGLWDLSAPRQLEKVRHRLALGGGLVAEVDVYAGRLAGLVVVEVEFEDAEVAEAFVPPDWFGEELTGRSEWSNATLALDGLPPGESRPPEA